MGPAASAALAATERVILVDWGTSSFRAWLLDPRRHAPLDEIASGKGLRDLQTPDFPAYAAERLAPWRAGPTPPPIYMAGMVGSAQGWQAAPQLPCPVTLEDLARHTTPANGLADAWIVPGCRTPDGAPAPDLMRGEEVQIFGALEIAGIADADLCLPGTHSKWAQVRAQALVGFATAMTGEVYATLLAHTILGRPAAADKPFCDAAFAKGLDEHKRAGGLLHHLFSARSRHVQGELTPLEIPSYLSGLLIGHEVASMAERASRAEVLLVCAAALRQPYARALAAQGLASRWIDARAASIAGLRAVIARHRSHARPQ